MSTESEELVIFIDNDGDLYQQRGEPIRANLSKKFREGNYIHSEAVKLWKYLADDGAKKYAKENATAAQWNRIFSVADRNEAAQEMANNWLGEMEAGNFHDGVKSNPAKRGAWKKIHGVVQPGGIYQLGSHPVFIYPPNSERVAAQNKWLLLDGKTTVGAFVSLKAAKDHYAGYIEAGHTYGANPATRFDPRNPRGGAVEKITYYDTYAAWRRAVIRLGGKGGLYGDMDIGGAKRWESEGYGYYAEWDGAQGEIERVASEVGRQANPATRNGTSHPQRNSQITGKKVTRGSRLNKRRLKNTEVGYFPNPVNDNSEFTYIIQQRAKGRIDNVCAASHRKIAETLVRLLMDNAAPGVLFTIAA